MKSVKNLLCFKNIIKSWNGSFRRFNGSSLQEVVLCELILNFLKKNFQKLCVVCSEIPFGEASSRIGTSQNDLQFGSIDYFLYDFSRL